MTNDKTALEIGRELMGLLMQESDVIEEVAESFGRIALKLCRPVVLEELRVPTEAMLEAGIREAVALDWVEGTGPYEMGRFWQAMIDAAPRRK